MQALITNPTGGKVRNDSGGSGHYGSPRSKKTKEGKTYRYAHRGTDFEGRVGQHVCAPIGGLVVREAKPYAKAEFSGVVIVGKKGKVKMFYFQPKEGLIGAVVSEGEKIGIMQDISKRYSKVTPHLHLQIEEFNPELLTKGEE